MVFRCCTVLTSVRVTRLWLFHRIETERICFTFNFYCLNSTGHNCTDYDLQCMCLCNLSDYTFYYY